MFKQLSVQQKQLIISNLHDMRDVLKRESAVVRKKKTGTKRVTKREKFLSSLPPDKRKLLETMSDEQLKFLM